jgi:hypothetical protein
MGSSALYGRDSVPPTRHSFSICLPARPLPELSLLTSVNVFARLENHMLEELRS